MKILYLFQQKDCIGNIDFYKENLSLIMDEFWARVRPVL
jgi:hypothetical protein